MKFTTITAAALAATVLALPGCRREPAPTETARTASATQAVHDAWITTKVEAQYFANPEVKGRQIDVSTNDGVVTLTGVVDSEMARQQAVTIARQTEGVSQVQDRMAVRTADQVATTGTTPAPGNETAGPADTSRESTGDVIDSAWTTTKIQAQYFADPDVKGRNIDVTTHDHVVTLAGHVENEMQRQKAVQIARNTEGVTDVQDRLRVGTAADTAASGAPAGMPAAAPETSNPATTDDGLVARVQSKFYQHETLRRSSIDVSASGGVVTLSGTVASEARKRDAVAVARNTDGVTDVRDELRVDASVPSLPPAKTVGERAEQAAVEAKDAASDAWLTTRIQASFYLDSEIKGRNIDVSTEKGVVTLSGTVASATARDRAMTIARDTDGVTRVVDKLTVGPEGGR